MRKEKTYDRTRFDSQALSEAVDALKKITDEALQFWTLTVRFGDASWQFNTFEEFLAACDRGEYHFSVDSGVRRLSVSQRLAFGKYAEVAVGGKDRNEIEAVFSVFEKNAERCRLPDEPPPPVAEPEIRIFIGHGRDPQWRDLKDHLQDKHGYDIDAYEIGARAGHTIRDILEEMLAKSTIAFLVLTGEDEATDGTLHARQNVIHETGLFQGRLGFSRAIVLLEGGTDEFSNIQGIQQIRFAKDNIKETFGDVLAVIRREFGGK